MHVADLRSCNKSLSYADVQYNESEDGVSLLGKEFSQWQQHCHLNPPAVNMHTSPREPSCLAAGKTLNATLFCI